MKRLLLLALVAGCTDSATGDLLSSSRISITELATPTIIQVDAPDDHDVSWSPHTLDGTAVTDLDIERDGSDLGFMAGCTTAHGSNTTLLVDVTDETARPRRTQTLVVDVANNGSDACLADVKVWIDCQGDTCGDAPPCSVEKNRADAIILTRNTNARVCVRAKAVDETTTVIGDVKLSVMLGVPAGTETLQPLQTTAQKDAFEQHDVEGGRALEITGHDWLVGPFAFTATTHVGSLDLVRTLEMDIGDKADVGIELTGPLSTIEFVRSQWDVVVHHFPETMMCMLAMKADAGFVAKLSNGTDSVDPVQAPLPCEATHTHYTLGVVPTIDAALKLHAELLAGNPATPAQATISVGVQSAAENLGICSGGNQKATAADGVCADIDNDGTVEILQVSAGTSGGCLVEVKGAAASGNFDWRAGVPASFAMPTGFADVFSLATSPPQIWAVDMAGQLYQLTKSNFLTPGTFSWAMRFPGLTMGPKVVPYGPANSPPTALASLLDDNSIQFQDLGAGHETWRKKVPISVASAVAIGASRLATGPGIVVVSSASTMATSYSVGVYPAPDLNPLSSMQGTFVAKATGVAPQMPTDADVQIAGRGTGQQDLVMNFFSGEFASAVTELQINAAGTGLVLANNGQYGGVNSLASTPEGDVLLGLQLGAKLSTDISPNQKYTLWDPLPPANPSSTYGRAITPCLDGTGTTIGFAERTESAARALKAGISAQLP
ncbi:MAG TPA: hypothetical protein VGM39_20085 [Kofleriaceae bacterium]